MAVAQGASARDLGQNLDILTLLSELPDVLELRVGSIVGTDIPRIRERSLPVTRSHVPDNALVIRLDYACLLPSKASLDFLRQIIHSFIALSADEQSMIRRDIATLLPVLTTAGLTDIEGGSYALGGLVAAINPTSAIGLYMQTIVLYIAAYMIWRLIVQITSSIPFAPGMDTKHTIVVIDILGLEFRLPLECCATFEDFHSLIAERALKQHKSAAKYVLSRAYEVADKSNSAVIYPHIWSRKVRPGMRLEMAVLLRCPSVACPWCHQENMQALWIHCDCGRTFEASAASQMGPRDNSREQSTAFIDELPESSRHTSSSPDFDSFAVEQSVTGAGDDQDELLSFRKVHVIFDDLKGKVKEGIDNDPISTASLFTPRTFPPPSLTDVPVKYIIDQLHILAPQYWDKTDTADCTLVIPVPHAPGRAGHPFPADTSPFSMSRGPRMSFKLHMDYLSAHSTFLRDLFSGTSPSPSGKFNVPLNCLPHVMPCSPDHPIIFLPLPDPSSIHLLVHWMYFDSTSYIEDGLDDGSVEWEGIARNTEYLGLQAGMKVFLDQWYANSLHKRGKEDVEDPETDIDRP
ncbi:hypothetical protein B0H14DRAFT_2844775 [Mycena olivaceomarginata]|nr:hypothetical protein B0H14DRAFT_2844775 [Mycena olivaceomarginata]